MELLELHNDQLLSKEVTLKMYMLWHITGSSSFKLLAISYEIIESFLYFIS